MGLVERSKSAIELVFPSQAKRKKDRERQTSDPNQRELNEKGNLGHSLCHPLLLLLQNSRTSSVVRRGDKGLTQQEWKRAWKGQEEQEWGREGALARRKSPRRFVIVLHSVTMLELCLDACLPWISKCFGKVTMCEHVLKHQDLKTIFHKNNLQFDALVLRGTQFKYQWSAHALY